MTEHLISQMVFEIKVGCEREGEGGKREWMKTRRGNGVHTAQPHCPACSLLRAHSETLG